MAEHHHGHDYHPTDTINSFFPEKTPSISQVLTVATLFPVGSILFTIAGTLLALTVAIPLFIIFSPIIVPALLTIGLAVAGFLTSGAFGITALSSFAWLINYFIRIQGSLSEHFEHGAKRLQDTASYMGYRAQDVIRS